MVVKHEIRAKATNNPTDQQPSDIVNPLYTCSEEELYKGLQSSFMGTEKLLVVWLTSDITY